jgi:flagellin
VDATALANLQINSTKLPDNGYVSVIVQVVGSAQLAEVDYALSGIGAAPVTIEVAGNAGVEQLSFAASTHNSAIAVAINQIKVATGVSATLSGAALRLTSTAYGSREFVSVATLNGAFTAGKDYGVDAQVNINGAKAEVSGLTATVRSDNFDVKLDLTSTFGTTINPAGTTFQVTGGGAKFQLGSQVNRQGQVNVGIGSVASSHLGNGVDGYLSSLASGGSNSLLSGNTIQAQKILTSAIRQVADLRGRLGAFQKDILETNVNSLNVALENVTASESAIRDADFASETAALTRSQILVQANTSVLSQANASPQAVLSLLGR